MNISTAIIRVVICSIICLFLIPQVFADDYIYTNKDLEKYKTPALNISQPPANTGGKKTPIKKSAPAHKKHRTEKTIQYIVPPKQKNKQTNRQDDVTLWPQNVTTQ